MGIHYYDSCTDSVEVQHRRLTAARAVAAANIPCVVWAEDALSLAFFVPTVLFNFQILVPDALVDEAARVIEATLPYRRTFGAHSDWKEYGPFDHRETSFFSNSLCLKWTASSAADVRHEDDDPEFVFIHPASHFSFDTHNPSRTMNLVPPLPQDNRHVLFPTRVAMFDALIDTILDPPPTFSGMWHYKMMARLSTYLAYMFLYTLRNRPAIEDEGERLVAELDSESAGFWSALKEENGSYFRETALRIRTNRRDVVSKRRTVLEKLGKSSSRPVPRLPTEVNLLKKEKTGEFEMQ